MQLSVLLVGGRPFAGAWIETRPSRAASRSAERRPFAGAWIETEFEDETGEFGSRRPFAGAWIETSCSVRCLPATLGRPFAGAWIETFCFVCLCDHAYVAPSRGRGLKLFPGVRRVGPWRRPFAGAWIETPSSRKQPVSPRPSPLRGGVD